MTHEKLRDRLQALSGSDDPESGTEELVEELLSCKEDFRHVIEILHCLENHPAVDFGTPGPLVHFLERFYKRGYEEELVKSLQRRPTCLTVWMLNRLINGTRNPGEKSRFMEIMRAASRNPQVDEDARSIARHFLAIHPEQP